MDVGAYFKGKKITVMGLGLLGGVGDIKFLAENGADIIATDLKTEGELRPSLDILEKFPNIRFTLGRHELVDFQDRDLVIKAPGTPLDSIYIAEARKNGIQISMWSALFATFAREVGATIVGVTGTRGKTTVTAMIATVLRAAGKHVIEGGNLQGTSVLPQLADLSAASIAVLELDSWKLQGFAEAELSPDIAVFTTFYQDHMNYYKDDMGAYLRDKATIFLFQTEKDTFVLGKQCAPIIIDTYGDIIESKTIVANELKFPESWKLCIPGQHNRYNAALALAALRALTIDDEITHTAFVSFKGVPGRLELVRDVNGVQIYNDTTATTPEATLAALSALTPAQTILIMGGADKGLDMNMLLVRLGELKRVILLPGTGTDRVLEFIPGASVFGELGSAVQEALSSAAPGDTILFSPAFASFGMFKNEYDRGDQFNNVIQKLSS